MNRMTTAVGRFGRWVVGGIRRSAGNDPEAGKGFVAADLDGTSLARSIGHGDCRA